MPRNASIPRICPQCHTPFVVPPSLVAQGRGVHCSRACVAQSRTLTPEQRFARGYQVTESGCWLWTKAHDTAGYGRFWDGVRIVPAHRFAYELQHGPLDDGIFACHHCDTPACVNPAHLFAGSHSDNMRDMHAKGRAYKRPKRVRIKVRRAPRGQFVSGNAHPNTHLTESDVRVIRARAAAGDSGVLLARQFGITPSAVCALVKRRTWKHVA